jgi:hypothetical protein
MFGLACRGPINGILKIDKIICPEQNVATLTKERARSDRPEELESYHAAANALTPNMKNKMTKESCYELAEHNDEFRNS